MGQGYYDDARYRTLQVLPNTIFGLLKTAALNGTAAAAAQLGYPHEVLHPVRVVSANGYCVVGGTNAVLGLALAKSLAGTGAATAFGTMMIGTSASAAVKDFTLTETDFAAGDQLILQRLAGTHADVSDVMVTIGYREVFS